MLKNETIYRQLDELEHKAFFKKKLLLIEDTNIVFCTKSNAHYVFFGAGDPIYEIAVDKINLENNTHMIFRPSDIHMSMALGFEDLKVIGYHNTLRMLMKDCSTDISWLDIADGKTAIAPHLLHDLDILSDIGTYLCRYFTDVVWVFPRYITPLTIKASAKVNGFLISMIHKFIEDPTASCFNGKVPLDIVAYKTALAFIFPKSKIVLPKSIIGTLPLINQFYTDANKYNGYSFKYINIFLLKLARFIDIEFMDFKTYEAGTSIVYYSEYGYYGNNLPDNIYDFYYDSPIHKACPLTEIPNPSNPDEMILFNKLVPVIRQNDYRYEIFYGDNEGVLRTNYLGDVLPNSEMVKVSDLRYENSRIKEPVRIEAPSFIYEFPYTDGLGYGSLGTWQSIDVDSLNPVCYEFIKGTNIIKIDDDVYGIFFGLKNPIFIVKNIRAFSICEDDVDIKFRVLPDFNDYRIDAICQLGWFKTYERYLDSGNSHIFNYDEIADGQTIIPPDLLFRLEDFEAFVEFTLKVGLPIVIKNSKIDARKTTRANLMGNLLEDIEEPKIPQLEYFMGIAGTYGEMIVDTDRDGLITVENFELTERMLDYLLIESTLTGYAFNHNIKTGLIEKHRGFRMGEEGGIKVTNFRTKQTLPLSKTPFKNIGREIYEYITLSKDNIKIVNGNLVIHLGLYDRHKDLIRDILEPKDDRRARHVHITARNYKAVN